MERVASPPRLLRSAALVASATGAVASAVLMLRAGRSTPPFLLVLFLIWIVAPFAALGWAARRSARWQGPIPAALCWVTIVIALGSLAMYGGVVGPPAGARPAFVFVIVAPVSALLAAVVVSAAAWLGRRRPPGTPPA